MKHIMARHQHLQEQNSQYSGRQQVFEMRTDTEQPNLHVQEFNTYHDFTQNL
ncbi:hypothetical protein X777_09923 [Ooceraea biroi]|uniref:Uncharacterized protein n=2 Tax=Ooceraea biroi TaxID=2015173 RepID=A0A026W6I9_OOCBI|nr:hypothetical protein X777_09923 [Ooceraea biroi]